MFNMPVIYGFLPNSWRQFTDVEILKKEGVYDIEKMQTLNLFHSAMNMNNKALGRNMMQCAEETG